MKRNYEVLLKLIKVRINYSWFKLYLELKSYNKRFTNRMLRAKSLLAGISGRMGFIKYKVKWSLYNA